MRRQAAICLGLAIFMLMTGPSCGLKSPPRLSKAEKPPRVKELKGDWEGQRVVLTGKLSGPESETPGDSPKWGVRVYHAWFGPGHDPCEGCPVSYPGYVEEVPETTGDGGFVCRVPMEKDAGTHFFEVRLVDAKGSPGPPSNRIKLVVESRPEAAKAARER